MSRKKDKQENKKMNVKITPVKVRKLREKMGSYAALAHPLGVTEMTIRRWEKGTIDINVSGYRFEVARLMFENGIS